MPVEVLCCIMPILAFITFIACVVMLEEKKKNLCLGASFMSLSIILFLFVWLLVAHYSKPVEYVGVKTITTIEGIQVIIVDNKPYNLTELYNCIFDEGVKIDVAHKKDYYIGLRWKNSYLYMRPIDPNGRYSGKKIIVLK